MGSGAPIQLISETLPISDSKDDLKCRHEMFEFMDTEKTGRLRLDYIHMGLVSCYGVEDFSFFPSLKLAMKVLEKNFLLESTDNTIYIDQFQQLILCLQRALVLTNEFSHYNYDQFFEYFDFRKSIPILRSFETFCIWAIGESLSSFQTTKADALGGDQLP